MKLWKSMIAAAGVALAVFLAPIATFAAGEGPMVDGLVTEIRLNNALTVKHGPLPNLDMPAMTMVFKLADPKFAKGIKKGDKIKFHAEDKDGKLTIMHMEKAK